MTLDIDADGASVVVTDHIEQRRIQFHTPERASVSPVDGDDFYFPVDHAVEVDSGTVTLGKFVATFVRTGAGDLVQKVDHVDEVEFGAGTYSIEIEETVKLYLRVEGPMTVSTTGFSTTIEAESGTVKIGARSRHSRPAGTITTTQQPEDVMATVSAFASAIKTTSPERSYPTLRGHPPNVELGDELHIPEHLEPPESELTIEVPPSRRYIYPVSSLAFYLGASVVPGDRPKLVGPNGFEHDLAGPAGFEAIVEQTLKQIFLFDCVTRTEGFYQLDLHERRQLSQRVDFDWDRLYHASPDERLEAYLSIPFQTIEDLLPEWKVTTHLAPTPENVELLPFLVNDLAVIKLPSGQSVTSEEAQVNSINEFARGVTPEAPAEPGDFTRSATSRSESSTTPPTLIQPEAADSVEQIWADENAPIGATKASVQAFRNGLDYKPSAEIGVTVVVNDGEMADEADLAQSVYGDESDFPFDLRVYDDLSTDALEIVLETERDFLHYIGHIDDDGFECSDGKLDVREMDEVGIDAFFLNACSSYDQGMALLERGAVGGIVTLSEIINSGAARVGKSMVKLLNHGFTLRSALDVAKNESFVGGQYIVVGDGNVDVVQGDNIGAVLVEIDEREDAYEVTPNLFPTKAIGMGSFASYFLAEDGRQYLVPGVIDTFEVPREEAQDVVDSFDDPLWYQDGLYWPNELELE